MFERFTDRARKVMALANQEAQRFEHEHVGPEHILLGIVKEGSGTGATVLKALGVDLSKLRTDVERLIKERGAAERPPKAPSKRAIERAVEEARGLNHRYIGTEHIMLGLVHDEGLAGQALRNQGVTIESARKQLLSFLGMTAKPARPNIFAKPDMPAASLVFERFTDRARKVMALANQEAQRFNHEYIGTEHLLLGLVKEGSGVGANVLKNLDVDLRRVRLEVEKLVKPGPKKLSIGKLPQTPRAQQVVKYAIDEARSLNHNYVGTEHLLLGLLREHDGVAAQVLRQLGLDLQELRREVLNLLGAGEELDPRPAPPPRTIVPGCPMCDILAKGPEHASFIASLSMTTVLLGENQGSRGWCVLVLQDHVEHLAELSDGAQRQIWSDVAKVAGAIRYVYSGKGAALPRINYECLGNLVPHIHWHIIPRHADDPEPTKAVWVWPEEKLRGTMSEREREVLIKKLRRALG